VLEGEDLARIARLDRGARALRVVRDDRAAMAECLSPGREGEGCVREVEVRVSVEVPVEDEYSAVSWAVVRLAMCPVPWS